MKKKKFLILFVILFFVFWGSVTFAQAAAPSERPLEIKYPNFPEVSTPETVATSVPNYIKYIYYLFLFVAGLIALGSLFYASFRYITSAGQPDAMKDARDQIFAAVFGVIILLASWIILNQINPNLTQFSLKPLRPSITSLQPGVLLCKEQVAVMQAWQAIKDSENLNKEFNAASADRQKEIVIELSKNAFIVNNVIASTTKVCWQVPAAGNIPDPFNDKVEWVYLIPSTASTTASAGNEYGVILYQDTKFGGKSMAMYTLNYPDLKASEWAGIKDGQIIKDLKPSSVKPFILNYEPQPRPVWYVNLYELIDYNKADPEKTPTEVDLPTSGEAVKTSTVGEDKKIGSLKIEGKFIVVFFKEKTEASGDKNSWQGDIDVFSESDTNLNDNLMGTWCGTFPFRSPCAPGGLAVISGSIY